jgi:hypothetical protein
VERAHRKLGARLTDRLRGDDADSLAELHHVAGREAATIALLAGAMLGLTRHDRADVHVVNTGSDDLAHKVAIRPVISRHEVRELLALASDDLTGFRMHGVLREHTPRDARPELVVA